MALFKIFKGLKNNLPANKVEGYCYVTTDEGKMYIDYKPSEEAENILRMALNAETADNLGFVGQETQRILLVENQTYGSTIPSGEGYIEGQLYFVQMDEGTISSYNELINKIE